MVPRVELRKKPLRMDRLTDRPIEVDHGVPMSGSTDPLIDCLPVRLSCRIRMIGYGTDEWRQGRHEYRSAVLVCPLA